MGEAWKQQIFRNLACKRKWIPPKEKFKTEENITEADAVQSCNNLDRFGISGFGKIKPITPADRSKKGVSIPIDQSSYVSSKLHAKNPPKPVEHSRMELDLCTSNGKVSVANVVAEGTPGDISSMTESQTVDCKVSYHFNQLQHDSYFNPVHVQQMIDWFVKDVVFPKLKFINDESMLEYSSKEKAFANL